MNGPVDEETDATNTENANLEIEEGICPSSLLFPKLLK